MQNPSNVYIIGVEMVAILSLASICIMGMWFGRNEIAAAAVGGIAGFISHKSMANAYGSEQANSTPPVQTQSQNSVPETKDESKKEPIKEENIEDVA